VAMQFSFVWILNTGVCEFQTLPIAPVVKFCIRKAVRYAIASVPFQEGASVNAQAHSSVGMLS